VFYDEVRNECAQIGILYSMILQEPDTMTKVVRFICGFIFGLMLFFFFKLFLIFRGYELVYTLILMSTVTGLFAAHYGDSFWYWCLRKIKFWYGSGNIDP